MLSKLKNKLNDIQGLTIKEDLVSKCLYIYDEYRNRKIVTIKKSDELYTIISHLKNKKEELKNPLLEELSNKVVSIFCYDTITEYLEESNLSKDGYS